MRAAALRRSAGEPPLIMGVLNVTPDSFSDGGSWNTPAKAAARALTLQEAGADLIDMGAESTRPGAVPVPADEELRRLLPALKAVKQVVALPVSVDTYKAAVAAEAVAAGADIINDVTGLGDPGMAPTAA
ncbi:MAG: dihydropteroate synthase, partial [Candidatus Methanomethylophilus sp.]|nr:dihydropteroate synthase [Methanomethylophilus sp.]